MEVDREGAEEFLESVRGACVEYLWHSGNGAPSHFQLRGEKRLRRPRTERGCVQAQAWPLTFLCLVMLFPV